MFIFFFNDTATTEIYTLSLHDALPIWEVTATVPRRRIGVALGIVGVCVVVVLIASNREPGESPPPNSATRSEGTRLNSSHSQISYAVFCLKKKKKNINTP